MGVLDTVKLVNKARQAKKKMEKLEVVGSDDNDVFRILMNGVGDVVDVEVDAANLQRRLNGNKIDQNTLDMLRTIIEDSVKKAFKNVKKNLEKELANQTSLDDLKDLLS
jgi:DNA-binding protein YbaB